MSATGNFFLYNACCCRRARIITQVLVSATAVYQRERRLSQHPYQTPSRGTVFLERGPWNQKKHTTVAVVRGELSLASSPHAVCRAAPSAPASETKFQARIPGFQVQRCCCGSLRRLARSHRPCNSLDLDSLFGLVAYHRIATWAACRDGLCAVVPQTLWLGADRTEHKQVSCLCCTGGCNVERRASEGVTATIWEFQASKPWRASPSATSAPPALPLYRISLHISLIQAALAPLHSAAHTAHPSLSAVPRSPHLAPLPRPASMLQVF